MRTEMNFLQFYHSDRPCNQRCQGLFLRHCHLSVSACPCCSVAKMSPLWLSPTFACDWRMLRGYPVTLLEGPFTLKPLFEWSGLPASIVRSRHWNTFSDLLSYHRDFWWKQIFHLLLLDTRSLKMEKFMNSQLKNGMGDTCYGVFFITEWAKILFE